MINGKTRTCGLIGCPVEHTKSPLIHNTLAEYMGIDLAYVPFCVQDGDLQDAIKGAKALNLLGLNVTVPYKSNVIPFLKDIDPLAKQIGAVNTLVRVDGGYKGYNTDMPGLYRAMVEDGIKIEGEQILLLGAGGVARAVALLMAQKKAKEIVILNRTIQKAKDVCDEVSGFYPDIKMKALSLDEFDTLPMEKYLAIQATNIGMYPKVDEAILEASNFYDRVHTGYDLVFNPEQTKFMKLVKAHGGKSFNGLKMLLYQGIIAYEYWTDTKVPKEAIQRVYQLLQADA